MGFTLLLESQLAGAVLEAAPAAAGRFAANLLDLGEGGDEDGLGEGDLLEPAGEHAADIAGMTANTHGRDLQSGITNKYQKTAKKKECEK